MSDASIPSEGELKRRFKPRLRAELDAIERHSDETAHSRAPVALDQQSVGRLSRIDAMQDQAMAQATDRRRGQRKLRILSALQRMETGGFGYCPSCDEFIGLKRLEFDPTMVQCMACARQPV